MIQVLPEILLAGLIVGIATVYAIGGSQRIGITTKGWAMVLAGAILLLIGSSLDGIGPIKPLEWLRVSIAPNMLEVAQALIELIGGGVLLTVGMIRWVMAIFRGRNGKRHKATNVLAGHDLHALPGMLDSILKSSINGILLLRAVRDKAGSTMDMECLLINSTGEQLLGRAAGDVLGKRMMRAFPCLRVDGLLNEMISVIKTGLPYDGEKELTQGGQSRQYHIVAVKHGDGVAVTVGDITAHKRSEEKLRHTAEHDDLTGLPNRALFIQAVRKALHRADRVQGYKFAVLFLDFDRFKIINDSLGHEAGDQLLINIAERLRTNLRSLDTSSRQADHMPARLGGDEFVVLLDGIARDEDAALVAERLQKKLSDPHSILGHEVISTASMGIVTSHTRYTSPDDIIRDADTAMYRAKTTGKARHVIFDQHMHDEVVSRLTLERELRKAVDSRSFEFVFEPLVSLETGLVDGFETLIRWPHPTRGLLRPDDFIEVMEEVGLIVPLGSWILSEAIETLKRWRNEHPEREDLLISVNLSKKQLLHPGFLPMVHDVFTEKNVDPRHVWFEVTESIVMHDIKGMAPVLQDLKNLGGRLAMDDFGTGYSSLSSLQQLPFDVVKIDRSFISSVGRKRDYAAIVHAIIELASNLEIDVVAEGTETEDQLSLLQGLSCRYAQGRFFGQPLSLDEAARLLQSDKKFRLAA